MIAVKMSGALTKVLPWQCRGNTRGLLYRQRRVPSEMKRYQAVGENSIGFTNKPSPQGGTYSGDWLGDLLDQKSKSPVFPGGGGAMVTND